MGGRGVGVTGVTGDNLKGLTLKKLSDSVENIRGRIKPFSIMTGPGSPMVLETERSNTSSQIPDLRTSSIESQRFGRDSSREGFETMTVDSILRKIDAQASTY